MTLKFNSIEIHAETVADVSALLSIALPYVGAGNAPLRIVSPSIPSAPVTDKERLLRDAYRDHYGKGFSMKGRDGNPLDVLTGLESAGWPQIGSGQDDNATMEAAPLASLDDDGESFI